MKLCSARSPPRSAPRAFQASLARARGEPAASSRPPAGPGGPGRGGVARRGGAACAAPTCRHAVGPQPASTPAAREPTHALAGTRSPTQRREAGSPRAAFPVLARVRGGAGESGGRRVPGRFSAWLPCAALSSPARLDGEARRLGTLVPAGGFPAKLDQSLGAGLFLGSLVPLG